MEDIRNKVKIAENVLKNNNLYADVYTSGIGVCVEINWGDWKHEHLRCDYLMGLHGFTLVGTTETESDGSDCYSAVHLYV